MVQGVDVGDDCFQQLVNYGFEEIDFLMYNGKMFLYDVFQVEDVFEGSG